MKRKIKQHPHRKALKLPYTVERHLVICIKVLQQLIKYETRKMCVLILYTAASYWLDGLTAEERNKLFEAAGYAENVEHETMPEVISSSTFYPFKFLITCLSVNRQKIAVTSCVSYCIE